MRQIQHAEGDATKVDRIARVLSKLDDNKDGKIEIDDLVKVINWNMSKIKHTLYFTTIF